MTKGELQFRKIHDMFRPKIHRYLIRLVGEHEADDLTQEVFIKVHQNLKDFRGESQLSTWIYKIATNTAFDKLRSPAFKKIVSRSLIVSQDEKENVLNEEVDVWTGQKSSSIEETFIREEMWECIREFVEKLPQNYRSVVLLSDLEGFKDKEIADILNITLRTVKIRLHRGRSQLKKEFESHCGWYRDARNKILWDGRRP